MDRESYVSIDWTLEKLGFDEMPKKMAFESVADLVSSNEIDLYFDKSIQGTDQSAKLEMQYEENGDFLGALIGNGYSYQHVGVKLATALCVCSQFDAPSFAIQEYSYNDELFFVTDDEGIWNCDKNLDSSEVFFDKKQIESLSKKRAKSIDGKTKALALLARELAQSGSSKFRTGNKVNATAVKDHIISLAKKYEVSTGFLNGLDDVLSRALNELELKEIPPNQK
ncbi:MAG: hypothetical protein ACJAS1_004141 [Oleiphilaceae bacterium]|jgi:hypothetical protein